jgi:hypothetical protein
MDSICLGDDFIQGNRTPVDRCHQDAAAFESVKAVAGRFIADLQTLERAQLVFQASVSHGVRTLSEIVTNRIPEALQGATVDSRLQVYRQIFEEHVGNIMGNTSDQAAVLEAAEAVKQTGQILEVTLQDAVAKVDHFIGECDGLFTGVGHNEEYLLDICSQVSTECLESTSARHMGCCCAYNPMASLGKENLSSVTIPGVHSEFMGARRAGAAPRTLASTRVTDICAESWTKSQDAVAQFDERIRELGGEELLQWQKDALAQTYPQLFCADSQSECDESQLVPVAPADCPNSGADIEDCATVGIGDICEGDGECGTDNSLDNCGTWHDVYRKEFTSTLSKRSSSGSVVSAAPMFICGAALSLAA